jgi:hypothetical protein
MLLFCEVGDEHSFFEKVWKLLADDIQYNMRKTLNHSTYQMEEHQIKYHLIDQLTVLFNKCGGNIKNHDLPSKSVSSETLHGNRFIEEELFYNINDMLTQSHELQCKLNTQQMNAFHSIVQTVLSDMPGFFFVSGYGGTGKTFLWKAIITYLRAQKKIVLAVASSGVASLLLPGGRTAHSRFKIPCDLDETTTCDIKRGTMLAELIEAASLIIWDEAFMTHRAAFEALDRTLRDLMSTNHQQAMTIPFGGKVVVLGGDPRQILPVIEGGSRTHITNAAITNSPLWHSVTILQLTENMRLSSLHLPNQAKNEIDLFSRWTLDIGEGKIEASTKNGELEPSWIIIPYDFFIDATGQQFIYANRKYISQHIRTL